MMSSLETPSTLTALSPAGDRQPSVLLSPALHSTQLFLPVFPKPHGLVNQAQIIYVL